MEGLRIKKNNKSITFLLLDKIVVNFKNFTKNKKIKFKEIKIQPIINPFSPKLTRNKEAKK